MNEQTINRILDFVYKFGIPVLKIYIVLSMIVGVIVFAIVIFIIACTFKNMSSHRKMIDKYYHSGKR